MSAMKKVRSTLIDEEIELLSQLIAACSRALRLGLSDSKDRELLDKLASRINPMICDMEEEKV